MVIDKASALRTLLERPGILVAPGVVDAMSARAVQAAGFEAAYLGGYVMGQALGMTEPLMTATETVAYATHVADAIDIPLIVDANAGFGDLLHTRRTVQLFTRSGVAAIHIEDQIYPKQARYFENHKWVVSAERAEEKFRIAMEAKGDSPLVMIGRTDAREAQNGGLDEALSRCRAFLSAGADLVMPYATCAPTEMEAAKVVKELSAPLLYVASEGKREHADLSVGQLDKQGWKIVIFNLSMMIAAFSGMERTLNHLRQTGRTPFEMEEAAALRARIESLSGLEEMYAVERKSVPAGLEPLPG